MIEVETILFFLESKLKFKMIAAISYSKLEGGIRKTMV